MPTLEGIEMKKTLLAIAATVFFAGAYAQSHTQEAAPQTNTKSQAAAEAKKSAKPAGVKQIRDGSTAEGEGSGVKKATKSEMRGEDRQQAREARPHGHPAPGGTPK
jgi:Ni/Co efflux regulator RcnB